VVAGGDGVHPGVEDAPEGIRLDAEPPATFSPLATVKSMAKSFFTRAMH
jgi:hypothetical protein